MKFSGNVDHGTRDKSTDFGSDLNPDMNVVVFKGHVDIVETEQFPCF